MTSGTIDGLFGVIAQTNNFNDEYKNTVSPTSIDQINRDFDPHTKQDFSFTNIELTKQFDNLELKVKASTAERDYIRTGDVDGSVASDGFTSAILNAIMNGGVKAQWAPKWAAGYAAQAGAAPTTAQIDAAEPTTCE